MEGIGLESEGVDDEARHQFDEEEEHVDGEHNADPRRLRPRHGGRV